MIINNKYQKKNLIESRGFNSVYQVFDNNNNFYALKFILKKENIEKNIFICI